MSARRTLRGFPVFATAAAGVLVGHWIAYLLTFADGHTRASVLAATGHRYLPFAADLSIVLLLAAVGAVIVRQLDAASPERERRPIALVARLGGRLWLLQGSIFVAMEVAERLGSGSPIAGVFRDHLLVVGLAAQLLVALAGAVLLLLLHRTAVVIVAAVRRLPTPQPPRVVGADSIRISAMPLSPLAGATGVRGPPPA